MPGGLGGAISGASSGVLSVMVATGRRRDWTSCTSRGWPSARAPKGSRRCNNLHLALLLHPLLRKRVWLILPRYLCLHVILTSSLIVVPLGTCQLAEQLMVECNSKLGIDKKEFWYC
jgi:hypothetical protein